MTFVHAVVEFAVIHVARVMDTLLQLQAYSGTLSRRNLRRLWAI